MKSSIIVCVALCVLAAAVMVAAAPVHPHQFLGKSVKMMKQQQQQHHLLGQAKSQYSYKTLTFKQRLDHYNSANSATYEQRYLINDDYFLANNKTGPIFFYTGNEGAIELFAENTGIMWEWAPEFGALIVFAEHRYYGSSMPFGNQSFTGTNPGYLSVAQALSDYAYLTLALKEQYQVPNAAVISFGGSYGGMLSAWWRIKFPHIVDGAIAASAPILQFTNVTAPQDFNRKVTQDFREQPFSKGTCDNAWTVAFQQMTSLSSSSAGLAKLSSAFNLCSNLQTASDVDTLTNWIVSGLVDMAMTDYPYANSFLQPMQGWPINSSCVIFDNCLTSGSDYYQCAAQALAPYYNGTGAVSCYNISSDATSDLGESGWNYQSCTEMVMPIGQYGPPNDMFPISPWNEASFTQSCIQQFNVVPQYNWASVEYGAEKISAASNIVFSNGDLDPWSTGGVKETLNPSLPAVLIPMGAHHLDIRNSNSQDPIYVVEARQLEKTNILTWIAEAQQKAKLANN